MKKRFLEEKEDRDESDEKNQKCKIPKKEEEQIRKTRFGTTHGSGSRYVNTILFSTSQGTSDLTLA